MIPTAVGAYIAAAYFFTSSTSFANPAITVGRMFSNSFAGIAPSSVPLFIVAQLSPFHSHWPSSGAVPEPTRREGVDMNDKPVVLFLCTHNAGRSLAAKVLLDHYAAGRVEVRSAGSDPGSELNASVVTTPRRTRLDPSHEFPKAMTDADALESDLIVTMGCGDTCPVYPGKRYLDWDLEDPAGLCASDDVRPIVEEIDRRVRTLLESLITT